MIALFHQSSTICRQALHHLASSRFRLQSGKKSWCRDAGAAQWDLFSLFLWAKISRGLTSRSLHFTSRNFPYKNKDPGLISACGVFSPDTFMRARLSALP